MTKFSVKTAWRFRATLSFASSACLFGAVDVAAASTIVSLQNIRSGKCIDDKAGSAANGNPFIQYDCSSSNINQQFALVTNSNGTYSFVNLAANKCLDVTDGSRRNGTKIQLWTCGDGNPNQQFVAKQLSSDTYSIVTSNGNCIDVPGGSTTNGTPIQEYACNSSGAQVFRIVTISASTNSGRAPASADTPTSTQTPTPSSNVTPSGVTIPSGWSLKRADIFGTSGNVGNYGALHSRYMEGQFYNRDGNGLVYLPNVVINGEQQTYDHFENVISFSSDHMTIQARGQSDGSITSGEMVSVYTSRNFCVEAKYTIPYVLHAWPAFWQYGASSDNDSSELDFEQPISQYQGTHDVTMHNHPSEGTDLQVRNSGFSTDYMNFNSSSFDASIGVHSYTSCYDDGASQISRYIDGNLIYTATYKWNASMGGTGRGADATTILNLAVGGGWPGYTSDPVHFAADMNIYSVNYYGP
jgi:hypothetical protein